MSPERLNVAEAETVPVVEGSKCAIDKRDGVFPPGSKAAPRTKGRPGNLGDPAGSIGVVTDGDVHRGRTGEARRADAGSRTGP
jgi:hypothetical protein